MKKLCLIISVTLCAALLFNSIAAFADTGDDGILTLEEAMALALKNDVQYNMQDSYIEKAKENYDEVLNDNSKNVNGRSISISAKASSEISQEVAIENAASGVRKAIFNRDDYKRNSDYDVITTFYGVIKARYSLTDAEADLELKKNALEAVKIKYSLGLITMEAFSQADVAYLSSQTAYNNASSELQISTSKLSNSIGKDIAESKAVLDMTLSLPDIKSLDLSKIKTDNLKNNSSYYTAEEQYKQAKYKLQLTQEQYDYYYDKFKSNSTLRKDFDDMLYEAQRDFDDTKYTYSEKLYDMDFALENQFTSINDLYESYISLKEEFEDSKLTYEVNKTKYQMGLISKSALKSSTVNLIKLENQLNTTIMNLNTQYVNITQYSID